MLDRDRRKIIARLHRVEGQLRGLEGQITVSDDVLSVIAQFDAAISATKGVLNVYIEEIISDLSEEKIKKLISRLIKKN